MELTQRGSQGTVSADYLDRAIALEEIPPNETPAVEAEPSEENVGLLTFAFVVILIVVLVKRVSAWKFLQGHISNQSHSPAIPCSQCRFFNSNPHLKCAVHPSKVSKAAAIDCPDYWPKNSNKFPQ